LKEFGIKDGDVCVLQHIASYAQNMQQQGERFKGYVYNELHFYIFSCFFPCK
jgi:hypothetical protein